jgi:hypothetical protein
MHSAPTFFTFGESCLLLMYDGQSTLSLHSVRRLFPGDSLFSTCPSLSCLTVNK